MKVTNWQAVAFFLARVLTDNDPANATLIDQVIAENSTEIISLPSGLSPEEQLLFPDQGVTQ